MESGPAFRAVRGCVASDGAAGAAGRTVGAGDGLWDQHVAWGGGAGSALGSSVLLPPRDLNYRF